jgi:PAS domain S-box-containing protein
MEFLALTSWGEIAAAFAAIVTAILLIHKYVMKPLIEWISGWLSNIINALDLIPVLAADVQSTKASVDKIKQQVYPNGGSALADAVTRIENAVTILSTSHEIALIESGAATFLTDPYGKIIDVNRELVRFLGRSEGELLGHGWLNSIDPDSAEEVEEIIRAAIARTPPSEFTINARFIDPTKGVKNGKIQGYPLFDKRKQFQGYRAFVRSTDTKLSL